MRFHCAVVYHSQSDAQAHCVSNRSVPIAECTILVPWQTSLVPRCEDYAPPPAIVQRPVAQIASSDTLQRMVACISSSAIRNLSSQGKTVSDPVPAVRLPLSPSPPILAARECPGRCSNTTTPSLCLRKSRRGLE